MVDKDANGNAIDAIDYSYDVNNRRIAKTVTSGTGTQVERMVYDRDNIALTFDGSGTQTHRYLYGPEVDQVLADENASGQVLWALADNQGTVRDLIDSTGTTQNHIKYDSFGNITSQTNPAVDFRFGYTGQEFDKETGQYYYRARYYDAGIGMFLSEDPLGFAGGDANFYRYVENSPVNSNDPSGLAASSNYNTDGNPPSRPLTTPTHPLAPDCNILVASAMIPPRKDDHQSILNCWIFINNIKDILYGHTNNKGVYEKGLIQRYRELRIDEQHLYEGNPGVGTWKGHIRRYNDEQAQLQELLKQWNDNCDDDDSNYFHGQTVIAEAKNWEIRPAPNNPERYDKPPSTNFQFPDLSPLFKVIPRLLNPFGEPANP